MTGHLSLSRSSTPPRRALPALTMRQRVDRILRGRLVRAISDLPRRPSDGWHHVARGHVRPTGKLPERLVEAAAGGASRERFRAELHQAIDEAIDAAWEQAA